MRVFKYLMLCASVLWMLPSLASVFDRGHWAVACAPDTVEYGAHNARIAGAEMTININDIRLDAGVDNRGLTALGPRFECNNLTGFVLSATSKNHLGVVHSNPALIWHDGEYFNMGNGLAMKVMVDGNTLTQSLLSTTMPVTTFSASNTQRNPEKLTVAIQATLKVVGEVTANTVPLSLEIGTFEYTMTDIDTGLGTTVYAPIRVNIAVQRAVFKSCTLGNSNSVFSLPSIFRADLEAAGAELHGGEVTIGPVICPEGLDVKVNLFDNATAAECLTDYLHTVYSDDNTPSQYAFKLYPVNGGRALRFLPRTQLHYGLAAIPNETTIDLAKNTDAGSSVQQTYYVKYFKLSGAGEGRPGKIKAVMTVQFLYY